MVKLKAIISAIIGVPSIIFGVIGALSLCFCTFPALGTFLGSVGISSLFLIKYHDLFLFTGIIFISLSIFYLIRSMNKKECPRFKK